MAILKITRWKIQCLYIVVHAVLYSDCTTFNGLDVLGVYNVHNRQQCQRLCWYRTSCVAFSYHGHQAGRDNCLLHEDPVLGGQLPSGWTFATASTGSLTNACAARPCQNTEVCVPVGMSFDNRCLLLQADCGTPELLVNNTLLSWTNSRPGDVATVTCKPGYVMVPQNTWLPTLTCSVSGIWEATNFASFVCEPIDCGEPQPIVNNTELIWTTTNYGDVASMTCGAAYVIKPGNATPPLLMCDDTGQWVPQQPFTDFVCEQDCGAPELVVGNTILRWAGTRSGDVATMTCKPNYVLEPADVSPPSLVCNGTHWIPQPSSITFSCRLLDCGLPEPIVNNTVLNWTTTYPGDVATMTCHPDYVMLPQDAVPPTLTCNASEYWVPEPPIPNFSCQLIDCGEPQPIVNNTVLRWTETHPGDVAMITCKATYVMKPQNATPPLLMCDDKGQWVPQQPFTDFVCEQDCGIPQAIVNNTVLKWGGTRPGDVAEMTCKAYYVIQPADATPPSLVCNGTQWLPQPPDVIFSCDPLDCGQPEPIVNNTVLNWTTTYPGDVATMTCDPDCVMLPQDAVPPTLTCNASEHWVPEPPIADFTCQRVNFHNITFPFVEPLPWNITDGWEACVMGTYTNRFMGLDFAFLEEASNTVDQVSEVEFYLLAGGQGVVSWNQKTAGKWASGTSERQLDGTSPFVTGERFRLSFHLWGDVLNITLHDVVTYSVGLTATASIVDLSTVNYFASYNQNDIDYVSLTSAEACM